METLYEMDLSAMFFIICLLSVLCIFLTALCLLLFSRSRKHVNTVRRELFALGEKVKSLEISGEVSGGASAKLFEHRLDPDQLKERFANFEVARTDVSGKYSHVARLERSGLGSGEIAEILDVSRNEAEQMLSLARTSGAA